MDNRSIAGALLRNLGITGTGLATGNLVPPHPAARQQDKLESDFSDAGKVQDPDSYNKYSTLLKRPVTYESMLSLWEEMSSWDLMAAALVEIVDEAVQTDSNDPATLWYECNDPDMEDELNDMLLRIRAEEYIPSQVWYTAAFGNSIEKLDYAKNDGVLGFNFAHPMDIRRYWLERNRQCVGFKWAQREPDKENAFHAPDGTEIPRVGINSDKGVEDLWYPWDFLHFRRMYRLRFTEHGEPIFDEAQGIYKKLRIALDQMVIHRAQVQPDRYVMNIDVKDQVPADQMRTVQRWKQTLRSKLSFGQGTSDNIPDEFKAFYNAWSLDTILYVPKPEGFQHSIEKLPGTASVPDVYDIELLENLFFSIIGMPKWWIMGGEGGGTPSGKALLATDMRFLRKVKSIRKPIIQGYTWLGYFHALLQGKDISQLEIKAKMSPIGGLEEQQKLEILQAQTQMLGSMGELMQTFNLPREAWVDVIFKRYLHLPDEVVDTFVTSLPAPMDVEESSGSKKKDITETKAVKLVEDMLGKKPGARHALDALNDALTGKKRKEPRMYKTANDVTPVFEGFKNGDIIRSSFQRDERPLKVSMSVAEGKKKGKITGHIDESERKKTFTTSPTAAPESSAKGAGYRKFIGERM